MIPEHTRVKLNVPCIRQDFLREYGCPSRRCQVQRLENANKYLNRILDRSKQRPWLWSTHIPGIAEISTDPNGENLSTIKIPMDCIIQYSPVD